MSGFAWTLRGRAWVFGHDVAIDGDLMPLEFALRRETDPEVLRHHLFAQIDPGLAARLRPGDIVVAGRRFAQGNPHIQGLLGLRGAGLGLVAESVPGASFRNAVCAGLRMLPSAAGAIAEAATGDALEVDFETGRFRNLTRGTERHWPPLPPALREIVELGGWEASFARRLAAAPSPA
jgi:3-isopropylmalate/(R)-2-methylmalate dehydratase small subunit